LLCLFTVAAALILVATSCRSWQVQQGPPMSDVQWAMADSAKQIRLVMNSGSSIDISAPNLVGDSIVGLSVPSRQRVAFAVTDVHSVARYKVDSRQTTVAVVAITLGALAFLAGVALLAVSAAVSSPRS
jgi:hypothetical protein